MSHSNRLDKLKNALSGKMSAKRKIDSLNELAWLERYDATKEAIDFAGQALKLASQNRYRKGIAYARLYKAVGLYLITSEPALVKEFLDVQEYFEKHQNESGLTICLRYLALVNESIGNF